MISRPPDRRIGIYVQDSDGNESNPLVLVDQDFYGVREVFQRFSDDRSAIELDIFGENFVPGSIARVRGTFDPLRPIPTTFVDAQHLTAKVGIDKLDKSWDVGDRILNFIVRPNGQRSNLYPDDVNFGAPLGIFGYFKTLPPKPIISSIPELPFVMPGGMAFLVKGAEFYARTGVGIDFGAREDEFNKLIIPNTGGVADNWVVDNETLVAVADPSLWTESFRMLIAVTADETSDPVRITFAPAAGGSVDPRGLVNAISFKPGRVSAGEIVSLFAGGIGPEQPVHGRIVDGLLEQSVGGVEIIAGGSKAPILFASKDQINFIAPASLASSGTVRFEVKSGGRQNFVDAYLAEAHPAIATSNGSGTGPAAVVHLDGNLNSASNPAKRGSIVAFYAVGAGAVVPPRLDGEVVATGPFRRLALPVSMMFGNRVATGGGYDRHTRNRLLNGEILYAGEAPGFISLVQINVRIPEGLVPGEVPVFLRVGDRISQPFVTLFVN